MPKPSAHSTRAALLGKQSHGVYRFFQVILDYPVTFSDVASEFTLVYVKIDFLVAGSFSKYVFVHLISLLHSIILDVVPLLHTASLGNRAFPMLLLLS